MAKPAHRHPEGAWATEGSRAGNRRRLVSPRSFAALRMTREGAGCRGGRWLPRRALAAAQGRCPERTRKLHALVIGPWSLIGHWDLAIAHSAFYPPRYAFFTSGSSSSLQASSHLMTRPVWRTYARWATVRAMWAFCSTRK